MLSNIEKITEDSIERLYEINRIRDILHAHSQDLINQRIVSIWGFGSTIKGNANNNSDIDICFGLQRPSSPGEWEPYQVQSDREKFVTTILGNETFPTKIGLRYGEEDPGRVTHITFTLVTDQTDVPRFVQDPVLLWSANPSIK